MELGLQMWMYFSAEMHSRDTKLRGNEAALPTREVESYEARDISPHLGVDGTPHIIGGRTIRQADWLVIFRSSFISTISFSPELQFSILLQVTTFSSVPIQDIPCNHVNPIIHA
jgi:hypothetical protein